MAAAPEELKPRLIEALRAVFDPEIPINIYDLGLIYDLDVDDAGDVRVRMTLTSPACPVAEAIPGQVESKLRGVAGVRRVNVELVWDPPWSRERMSEAARLQLGFDDEPRRPKPFVSADALRRR
ncbi:MAG TPA: SUF system Fe-S cluster assembly protein [Phycisphaerae bacterium]|nr:SUF system Fe-S cluster assembly protein [Phycisphaerae bacterium]